MKKYIIIVLLVLLVSISLLLMIPKPKASIIMYEFGTNNVLNKIDITSKKDINTIEKNISNMKPLSTMEMVELALIQEITLKYKNYSISIQSDIDGYCYFDNGKDAYITHISDEFYNFIIDKTKDNTYIGKCIYGEYLGVDAGTDYVIYFNKDNNKYKYRLTKSDITIAGSGPETEYKKGAFKSSKELDKLLNHDGIKCFLGESNSYVTKSEFIKNIFN